MTFTSEEQHTFDKAVAYAKKIKKGFAKRLTNKDVYLTEDIPVSLCLSMASQSV